MKDSDSEALRWLRQCENDLEFAGIALREGYHHQACFIAQQAAEKALKAIAYHRGARVVLGHSLVELVGRLEPDVPELSDHRESAGALDQFYVATRYPNGLPGGVPFEAFGAGQARQAIEAARLFTEIATAHVRG